MRYLWIFNSFVDDSIKKSSIFSLRCFRDASQYFDEVFKLSSFNAISKIYEANKLKERIKTFSSTQLIAKVN